jgi:hypothetical protein
MVLVQEVRKYSSIAWPVVINFITEVSITFIYLLVIHCYIRLILKILYNNKNQSISHQGRSIGWETAHASKALSFFQKSDVRFH